MNENCRKITIPDEVVRELELEQGDVLELRNEDQTLIIRTEKVQDTNQTVSLRWFLTPAVITTVLFFIFVQILGEDQIHLTGAVSISSMLILLCLLRGMGSYLTFFIRSKKNQVNHAMRFIYWRHLPTILISFVIMLGAVMLGFFWMLSILFKGASFDIYTATFIFFLFSAIINYIMIFFALATSPSLITTLLIAVILGGVILSMISNEELQWWQVNLSFLGTSDARGSWQFNMTLMISALLMVALIDFLFVILQHTIPKSRRLIVLRVLLTLTAIDLGAVGFFPNNGTGRLHELHNTAANYLVYLITILILGIRWLLPRITKEFIGVSYGIGFILIVCNFLFRNVGYLSLTAFELIAFFLAFTWIFLLLQNLQRLAKDTQEVYMIQLE